MAANIKNGTIIILHSDRVNYAAVFMIAAAILSLRRLQRRINIDSPVNPQHR